MEMGGALAARHWPGSLGTRLVLARADSRLTNVAEARTWHLFFEQRTPGGAEENEVTFTFQGPRTGMASWLADGGSGGAAERGPAIANARTAHRPTRVLGMIG